LGVVAGVVAGGGAFEFIGGLHLVGGHGQVAAEAAGGPGGVADLAGAAGVGVGEEVENVSIVAVVVHGEGVGVGGEVAPGLAIAAEGFGVGGLGVVAGGGGVDGVAGLGDFPGDVGAHHGALEEGLAFPIKTGAPGGGSLGEVVGEDLAVFEASAVAAGDEGGALVDGAVAVDALDGGGGAGFAVEEAVAVDVGGEVAVHALHAAGEVDVFQVDGLSEFLVVGVRYDFVVVGAQVVCAVFFEDGAEDPAVAVVVGELGVLELGVELGDFFQEFRVAPESADGGGLGVVAEGVGDF